MGAFVVLLGAVLIAPPADSVTVLKETTCKPETVLYLSYRDGQLIHPVGTRPPGTRVFTYAVVKDVERVGLPDDGNPWEPYWVESRCVSPL